MITTQRKNSTNYYEENKESLLHSEAFSEAAVQTQG